MVVCDKCRSPVQETESLKTLLNIGYSPEPTLCTVLTECVLCVSCRRLLCQDIVDAYEKFFGGVENIDVKITLNTSGKLEFYYGGRLEVLQDIHEAIQPPPDSG